MFPDKHTKKPVGVGSPTGYKDKEMEMDKIIKTLMAAAVLALMSACVRHETEDPDLGPTDNISMFPQMEDVSRSVINSTKELESHQIGVFGYKSASGGHQLIFDNKTLYYDAVWKYSGTRYWDKRAGYWFAAYVPFMGTSGSGTYVSESQTGGATSDHTLTIHNIPKWQTADQDAKDIMTIQEAKATLSEYNLTIYYVYSATIPSGIVISQSVQNGRIVLNVSKGAQP